MPLDQVATALEELAVSLKNRTITIQAGQETMQLTPPLVLEFEMKISQGKDKGKISVELSWEGNEAQDVRIAAQEPRVDSAGAPEDA